MKCLRNTSTLVKACRVFETKRKAGNMTTETRASMRAAFDAFDASCITLPDGLPIPWCMEKLRVVCTWCLNVLDADDHIQTSVKDLEQPLSLPCTDDWSEFILSLLEDTFDSMIKVFDTKDGDVQTLGSKIDVFLKATFARKDLVPGHVKISNALWIGLDPSRGTVAEVNEAIGLVDKGPAKFCGSFTAWNAGKELLRKARAVMEQGRDDDSLVSGFDALLQDVHFVFS